MVLDFQRFEIIRVTPPKFVLRTLGYMVTASWSLFLVERSLISANLSETNYFAFWTSGFDTSPATVPLATSISEV